MVISDERKQFLLSPFGANKRQPVANYICRYRKRGIQKCIYDLFKYPNGEIDAWWSDLKHVAEHEGVEREDLMAELLKYYEERI